MKIRNNTNPLCKSILDNTIINSQFISCNTGNKYDKINYYYTYNVFYKITIIFLFLN